MPVTRPQSGTIITKASITGMHATVRGLVNAFPSTAFARGALNEQQVANPIVLTDSVNTNNVTTIDVAFQTESTAEVLATWKLISGLLMTNGGLGYAISGPAIVLIYVTVRVERFYDTALGTVAEPAYRQQCWMCPTLTINGTETASLRHLGMVYGQDDGVATTEPGYVDNEEVMTIWYVHNRATPGAWTLTSLQVRAARGVSTSVGAVRNFKIAGGHMGFMIFPQG